MYRDFFYYLTPPVPRINFCPLGDKIAPIENHPEKKDPLPVVPSTPLSWQPKVDSLRFKDFPFLSPLPQSAPSPNILSEQILGL